MKSLDHVHTAFFFAAIPLIMSVIGSAVSAYSMYQQGKAQESVAKANAKAAQQDAANKAAVAGENAIRQREMHKRQLSTIRAKQAGSGTLMSGGSNLDILGDSASEFELQTLDLFRESEMQQNALHNQAKMERWQGKQAARAGTIGAIGTLFSGVGSAYTNSTMMKPYTAPPRVK